MAKSQQSNRDEAHYRELFAAERRKRGQQSFYDVMLTPAPQPINPYNANGIADCVFAELWTRPGLTRKERRWITLALVGADVTPTPIDAHVRAALESGDITLEEMREFVLHFAFYRGWPQASYVSSAVERIWTALQEKKKQQQGPG